jgi:hypothetical protein
MSTMMSTPICFGEFEFDFEFFLMWQKMGRPAVAITRRIEIYYGCVSLSLSVYMYAHVHKIVYSSILSYSSIKYYRLDW